MKFKDFCEYLQKIEATAKRLEMTSLLSELLKLADSNEVDKVIMLSLGRLAPLYKDIDFGLAEKTVIRAIALAGNVDAKEALGEFKKSGDLGETAMALINLAKITKKSEKHEPSVAEVFEKLMEIAEESGEGSQEKKVNKTADLLRQLNPLGAKYAVRIILQNLRLGFSDKTVLDALSVMITGDKSAREKLEQAYNVRPDVGWLAQQVKRKWSEMLEWKENEKEKGKFPASQPQPLFLSISVSPQLGVPIMPALCQRLPAAEEIIEKMSRPPTQGRSRGVAVEPKWDGQRLQAHVRLQPGSKFKVQSSKLPEINLFTRSLEDVTDMFPDLVQALGQLTTHNSQLTTMILDGEAVAIDPATGRVLPFQTMITRKRKYGIAEKLAAVPIKYMVFDILYLNGKSLMEVPFYKRRQILEKLLGKTVKQYDSETVVSKTVSGETVKQPTDLPAYRSTDYRSTVSPFHRNTALINIAPQLVTSDAAEIRKFLQYQISRGLEGIVAKRSDAPYIPGRTQFAWVKLKWEGAAKSGGLLDTVDCVVMGTYSGRGKRSSFGVGAFLVGILGYRSSVVSSRLQVNRLSVSQSKTGKLTTDKPVTENRKLRTDNGVFLTISKIGTGLTDEQWKELKVKGQRLKVKDKPKEYDVPKELTPDSWLRPELVVEIQADNITKSPLHTAGYALRFPRLVRYRTDKRADQVTTVEEVKKLYGMQK